MFLKNKAGAFRQAGLAGLGLLSRHSFHYIFQNTQMTCVSFVRKQLLRVPFVLARHICGIPSGWAGWAGLALIIQFSMYLFEITKLRTFGVLLKTTVGQSVYFIRTTLVHAAWLAWLGWVCFYYGIFIKFVESIIWRAFRLFLKHRLNI